MNGYISICSCSSGEQQQRSGRFETFETFAKKAAVAERRLMASYSMESRILLSELILTDKDCAHRDKVLAGERLTLRTDRTLPFAGPARSRMARQLRS